MKNNRGPNGRFTRIYSYLNRPDLTPEIRDEIVTECYRGERHADIAEKYRVSVGFVSNLKQKWDRANLYGQNVGENKG